MRRYSSPKAILGQGSYGVVSECWDSKTQSKVAVKTMLRGSETPADVYASMQREESILFRCRHPNIIELLDMQSEFMVFELMEGGDLNNRIESFSRAGRTLPGAETRKLMKQLLQALAHVHQKKVMHLDIKPSNLLLDSRGNLKLADFGASIRIGCDKREAPEFVCTIGFNAPELLLGKRDYGVEVDIWSAGCVFLQMLLGRNIFNKLTPAEVMKSIINVLGKPSEACWPGVSRLTRFDRLVEWSEAEERIVDLNEIVRDETAVDLVKKMLTYNPRKRINAREALEHEYFKKEVNPQHCSSLKLAAGVNNLEPPVNRGIACG